MSLSHRERTREQDQGDFVTLVERLRCYGDHCPFPACCPPRQTPQTKRPSQQKDIQQQAKVHDDATIARLHQGCAMLRAPPRVEEFAQQLFRHFFRPISLPQIFGDAHKAGIAACIWASCSEYKLRMDKENICLVISVGMEHFDYALRQIQEPYVQFRNRYFRRKLRAKAEAKGVIYDHDTRRRRRTCGRDVTGELRAQIFLMASQM